jgi:hypothetical protein
MELIVGCRNKQELAVLDRFFNCSNRFAFKYGFSNKESA